MARFRLGGRAAAGAAALVLAAGLGLFACARDDGADRAGEPLLAPPTQVEVLVEARALEPPPSLAPNRFVAGWSAAGRGRRRLLVANPDGARLEVVSLGGAARRLVLSFEGDGAPRGELEARMAGGAPSKVPLAARTFVPLPDDLPLGRSPVELRLPAGSPPLRAALDRALPAGRVSVGAEGIEQRGASLVELLRPLAGRAVVSGEVRAGEAGTGGGRVALLQRCGGADRVLWEWRPGWWHAVRPPRFRVPVGCASGWLQLRLLVDGPGRAVSWRRLELALQEASNPGLDSKGPSDEAAAPPGPGSAAATRARAPRAVLLYVFDALRADAVGAPLGGASATPTLDSLAREGALFTQHLAVAPNTLPSTKTLLTGHVWRQGGGAALPAGRPTLAEAFRAAGYRTGLFSGNVWVSSRFGLARGFEHASEEALFGPGAAGAPNENAARVGAAAREWLRGLPADAPVFLYLHVIHPHNPYEPPPPYRDRARVEGSAIDGRTGTLLGLVHRRRDATPADRRRIAALYRANLAYADARLGELVAALRERYGRDEVLVAATSDHGEELFDHGGLLHGWTLYEEQLRIPLVLAWPGAIPPARVDRPTSTVDLHRWLLALAEGRSRTPLPSPNARGIEGELHLAAAASVPGGIFAARTPRWKVVWAPRKGVQWGVGEGLGRDRDAEQVFDLASDARELRNLAGLVDAPEPRWLRARLVAWATGDVSPEADGGETPVDAETRARLEALGYVE